MATPTIYRWDDASAPKLSGSVAGTTNWGAILNACLVTGYGSKAAAGWTQQFTNAAGTLRVFQPASLEFGLQMDDLSNTTESYFRCADSWTDVSTPVNPWHTVVQRLSKSDTAAATPYRGWMVIATANMAAVFCWRSLTNPTPNTTSDMSFAYFGRYIPFNPDVVLANCTCGSYINSAQPMRAVLSFDTLLTSGYDRELTFQRGLAGGNTINDRRGRPLALGRRIYANSSGYTSSYIESGNTGVPISSWSTSNYLVTPFVMFNYLGQPLGYLPFVHALLGYVAGAEQLNLVQTVTIQGKQWLLVCCDCSTSATQRNYYLFDVLRNDYP